MRRNSLNDGWIFYKTGEQAQHQCVNLPHDAMLAEKRSIENAGGADISWFAGGDYVYEKTLDWPMADQKLSDVGRVVVEFEGVYRNAEIFLNGCKLMQRPYGYSNFYVDLTNDLVQGKNTLRVIAHNADQPNSRWYTGSGIYRPVNMYLLPKKHIMLNGIRVTTTDYVNPVITVGVRTSCEGTIKVEILKHGQDQVLYSAQDTTQGQLTLPLPMPGAALWSGDSPNLYVCRVIFEDDLEEVTFGVRTTTCTPQEGFCINGQRVILRGACVHHDNGVLGACAEPFAEERKVRLMQEAGYNAIRSAHNPCSKALLDACDRYGMLLVDEYVDMWYIHKTKYDYALNFDTWWQRDLADMIDKDYNHPSVIMYSVGNEVAETSQARGIDLVDKMTRYIQELDDTRKVTCGVNIFFNFLFSLGFGVYSDKKAESQASKPTKRKKSVGSEFFNDIAGIMGASFMKFGATLHGSDVKTRDAFAKMHVAGYNYGIRRYKKDLRKYPDRIIVGSETFCVDTYEFMETAKANPALIGDFVWAGMDYLGEAGIGAWEYKEYAPDFAHGAGWITAGSGRLDITGKGNGEALYTRVAFGLDDIHMAVKPVSRVKEKHSPSSWKMSNAIPSWSWNGLDGASATVEVYTQAARVELFLNNRKVGEKARKKNCVISFETIYQPGKLVAKAYDEKGKFVAQTALQTAQEQTILTLLPELSRIQKDDLCYLRIKYSDPQGETKPLLRGDVKVKVENGQLLGLGNGCSYNEQGYLNDSTDTYYGEALAVIRPDGQGDIRVIASSPHGDAQATIEIKKD